MRTPPRCRRCVPRPGARREQREEGDAALARKRLDEAVRCPDLGTPLQGLRLAFGEAIDAHNAGKSADSHHFKQNIGVAWTCINALMQLREMMMDESKLQLGQKLLSNQDTIDPVQTRWTSKP